MRNRVIQHLQRRQITPSVVFDVGANVGQSVAEFREAFPDSNIWAFEPVQATFDVLQQAVASDPNVKASPIALSRTSGEAVMTSNGTSTGNRVVKDVAGSGREIVSKMSGDEFCKQHGITSIDFLKIDTEGHDIEVALGFRNMLAAGQITFVQVECGLSPTNTKHVPYERAASVFFSFGFGLLGLFGLTPLRGTKNLSADYGDAVFVCDDSRTRRDTV